MTKLRKYIAMLLIVCMCTNTFANAVSTSYAVQALAYQAGEVLLRAAKNGVTKGLAVRPRPATIAKGVAGGLGATLVASIIADKLGEGIDWVMDPANNTIKYTAVPDTLADCPPVNPNRGYSDYVFERSYRDYEKVGDDKVYFTRCVYKFNGFTSVYDIYDATVQTLSLDEVSQDIIDRAKAGDKNAQNVVEQAVKAGFNQGIYDNALDDAKPFDEAGYETYTPETPVDVDLSGVAAAIAAMQSAIAGMGDAINDMRGALVDGLSDIKTSVNDLIDGQSAINDAIDAQTTDVVDAIDAQTTDIDESIKVGISDVVDSIDTQTGTVTDAIDAQTGTVSDVVNTQTDELLTGVDSATSDVIDSIDTQTGEITDAVGSQTGQLTDAIDNVGASVDELSEYVTEDEYILEDTNVPTSETVLLNPVDFDQRYITAPSQCPPDINKTVPVGFQSFSLVIPMTPVCNFGSDIINPIVIFLAYIQAALMIGSAFKVG